MRKLYHEYMYDYCLANAQHCICIDKCKEANRWLLKAKIHQTQLALMLRRKYKWLV